ncbi:transcriptional repressor [bacterium]|nr:transcriptional repressor [bacterium]
MEAVLRGLGIQPTIQRVIIACYVLSTDEHPSAEQVFAKVKGRVPVLSRATVYNTLNTFVEKGLLRELVLAEGNVVFDPNVGKHHHFIDDDSGRIHDVPWDAVKVANIDGLSDFEVRDYQVVMRGRRRKRRR